MPRLTEKQRDRLLADYHAGVNKNKLAIKYEISPVAVGKICRGLVPKHVDKVNTLTRIAIDLTENSSEKSSYEIDSINQQLSQRGSDFEFFRSASLIVARKAVEKVKNGDVSMFDLEKAQTIIGKGKENIYGKIPETAVQVNNNNQTTYKWESDDE